MTLADRFAAEAEALVGIRYVHQGRNPRVGLDCAGVVRVAAQRVGLVLSDFLGYSKRPRWRDLERVLVANFGKSVARRPRRGDIVPLRWEAWPEPNHLGVVIDGQRFVTSEREMRHVYIAKLANWEGRVMPAYEVA